MWNGHIRKIRMNVIRIILLVLFIGMSFSFLPVAVQGKARPIAAGDSFPDLSFRDFLSKGDRDYLGMGKKRTFLLKDMQGDFFIFEIFSTYCMSCPKNVPVLDTVYSTINNDPELRHKVKLVSVAVGNTESEAQNYKRQYKVLYPVLTDFTFAFHKALGNPRVPYTMIVRRDVSGKNIVVYTHLGVIQAADSLLNEVRKLLQQNPPLNKLR
jgi:thiol-disulfide isomerase/thioredoxin